MKTPVLLTVFSVVLLGLTGCSGSSADTPTAGDVESSASPAEIPIAEAAEPSEESKVEAAQRVKSRMDPLISDLRNAFGEGVNSPCSSSSSELFTSQCQDSVTATGSAAQAALDEMGSSTGYATLRAVAEKVLEAESGYTESQCSADPSDPALRTGCLNYGAVIAQAPTDLHEGVVAGLLGN